MPINCHYERIFSVVSQVWAAAAASRGVSANRTRARAGRSPRRRCPSPTVRNCSAARKRRAGSAAGRSAPAAPWSPRASRVSTFKSSRFVSTTSQVDNFPSGQLPNWTTFQMENFSKRSQKKCNGYHPLLKYRPFLKYNLTNKHSADMLRNFFLNTCNISTVGFV